MSKLKATKRLMGAIAALVASLILCVGVCLAWFAANGKVDANDLNSQIRTTNIDKFSVTAYSFSSTETAADGETVTYTVKGSSNGVMAPYGNIESQVTALLLKFDCTFVEDLGKTYEMGADFAKTIEESVVAGTGKYDLACNLSEVVEFFTADITGEITAGKVITRGIKLTPNRTGKTIYLNDEVVEDGKGKTFTFYCIIDYGEILIQNKYAYALNNIEGCSLNSQMSFENDLSFFVQEA